MARNCPNSHIDSFDPFRVLHLMMLSHVRQITIYLFTGVHHLDPFLPV